MVSAWVNKKHSLGRHDAREVQNTWRSFQGWQRPAPERSRKPTYRQYDRESRAGCNATWCLRVVWPAEVSWIQKPVVVLHLSDLLLVLSQGDDDGVNDATETQRASAKHHKTKILVVARNHRKSCSCSVPGTTARAHLALLTGVTVRVSHDSRPHS